MDGLLEIWTLDIWWYQGIIIIFLGVLMGLQLYFVKDLIFEIHAVLFTTGTIRCLEVASK